MVVGGFALALGEGYRVTLAEACGAAGWTPASDWLAMLRMGASDDDSGLVGMGRRLAGRTDFDQRSVR